MRELRCDQTGILLESGGKRLQSYLSYQGAGIFYQLEGGGFCRVGTRGRKYVFADLDALGDFCEAAMDEADQLGAVYGVTVGGPEPEDASWRRADFGDEGLTNLRSKNA